MSAGRSRAISSDRYGASQPSRFHEMKCAASEPFTTSTR